MAFERSTVRRARKSHECGSYRCPNIIRRGELYTEYVTSPGNPEIDNERWLRMRECSPCLVQRTGRTIEAACP